MTILHISPKLLISIAEESIPKTSSNKKHNKPWFNGDCKTAIRSRKAALRKFNLQPSAENLNNFKIHRENTRRVIKTSKKTSWRNKKVPLQVEKSMGHDPENYR